jgi:hypothetical protein
VRIAMFTAEDSRRGTLGQLAGGTVEVQVTDDFVTFRRGRRPVLLGGEGVLNNVSGSGLGFSFRRTQSMQRGATWIGPG